MEAGGGFAGVHAAACTEYEWPYYGELPGARFARHPEYQPGCRAVVEDRCHPAPDACPLSGSSPTSGTASGPIRVARYGFSCGPTSRRTSKAAWAKTTRRPGVPCAGKRRAGVLQGPRTCRAGVRRRRPPRPSAGRDQLGGGPGLNCAARQYVVPASGASRPGCRGRTGLNGRV